jgi:hypothetical protein
MAASPAWAAKKITVQQLQDLLASAQQAKKTDAEVAALLKQVELTEELTRATMNSLVQYVPGPYSTEQIYVLEARSAVLPPPASDLPTTAAPDAAAQKAIVDKAIDYATKTYTQLPPLTATKTTIRFQDNVEATAASSGMHSGATDSASSDPNLVNAGQFVHYINSTENNVQIQNGVEQNPLAKDKTQWGANGYIALIGNGPALSAVLSDAESDGKITFLRWESVNGKAAAVFTFSVDKKKTHYAVNYCCFPDVDQAGMLSYSARSQGSGPTAHGNMQTTTSWKNYKASIPYHGEVFIDPDSGIVVRLVTQAEFKNTDVVHQEDQRIDFAPVAVGSKTLVVPIKAVINTEVVPNGDSQAAGKYTTRHTLFTSEYKNYQAGS